MKAWDDNFVTDTGTAHDGRVTTVALSLSFLCLLSTVLPSLSNFRWQLYEAHGCHPKNDLTMWKKICWSVCAIKEAPCCFIIFIFYSAFYWRKEIKKRIHLCSSWQGDGQASRARVFARLTESEDKRLREREEEYEEKRDAQHERQWETQTMQQCDQKPDFTSRIQPLKDTWRPSMVTDQRLRWSGDDRYKNSRSFQKHR